MMRYFNTITIALLLGEAMLSSCKRELSCISCNGDNTPNKPPFANAGADQSTRLPKDSVVLDGSASSDPDRTISKWQWTNISGTTNTLAIANPDEAKTVVKGLSPGTFLFVLTVTDGKGASASDTVQVRVDSLALTSLPPVACAGSDQIITLPLNTTTLDGSCSTDPANNIAGYAWTKLAGPSSFSIVMANAARTQLINLEEGVYQFELTVTNAGGLSSSDTMQVSVAAPLPGVTCDGSTRPTIAARLTFVGTLPTPRDGMTLGAVGNKIVFAGGVKGVGGAVNAVDIYDTVTQQWSNAKLSEPRVGMAAVTAGDKLFLAGGNTSDGDFNNVGPSVDVYDAGTNEWSVMSLSERRGGAAAAGIGNKVFFAGGGYLNYYYESTGWQFYTKTVDIYDLSTSTWSTASLSEARTNISAVVVGSKIYFAGGQKYPGFTPSDRIDIYDNAIKSWSTASLLQAKAYIGGAGVDGQICWAEECSAEIINTATDVSKVAALSHKGWWYSDFSINAVVKNKDIVFFHHQAAGSDGAFDIYNTATDTWYVGVFPEKIDVNAVISVNNTIYLVGGVSNDDYKSKVWKVEF